MSFKLKVALIDYGMGNLRSVTKAVEKCGANIERVSNRRALNSCDIAILPGVGAFDAAVKNLNGLKLFGPIQDWIRDFKPFLGICLGYQLLFKGSEEGNLNLSGLNIFKGRVVKFPKSDIRVPHIGWNQLMLRRSKSEGRNLFSGMEKEPYFYFVHSFYPEPEEKDIVLTKTDYGVQFASSVARENLFACQFHPEKSGKNGLKLIQNFLNLYR